MTGMRKLGAIAAVSLAVGWATWVSYRAHEPNVDESARGFSGLGGGPLAPGGLGFFGVTNGSGLSGSGTSANPERVNEGSGLTWCSGAVCVGQGSGMTIDATSIRTNLAGGTCIVGSDVTAIDRYGATTCSANVSSVAAGSGITAATSSGAATVAVNAGSGITADGTSARVNAGSGLAFSSGALIVGQGSGITVNAATVQANLGAGLTFSAGAIVPNLTGGTCTNGQGVTSVSAAGVATCGNVGWNGAPYGGTHLEWNDEWMQPTCGTTAQTTIPCGSIWTVFETGASTQVGTTPASGSTAQGTTTRPGIIDINAGTTTTGVAEIWTGGANVDFGSGSWELDATLGFLTVSDVGTPTDSYAAYWGFSDVNNSANTSNGCGFLYDTQNVATGGQNSGKTQALQCYCASGATRTIYLINGSGNSDESFALGTATIAALTLPSKNIHRYKTVMTGTTRAEFYVDGTKVCDINTHIPSGASNLTGAMVKMVKNAGTTARKLSLDQTRVAVDLTSARSP